jgi:peptidoglycan/xylan/chitin deacetylase (PgdA/CDA1 family)/uncharacterized protein (DUF2062 family)
VYTIILAIGLFGLICWGIFWRNSSLLYPTRSRIKAGRRIVALTFDDGPHSKVTPLVLDILARYNIKATFFCVGQQAEKHPELIRRMYSEGHIIGNHSYEHSQTFFFFGPSRTEKSIRKTGEAIYRITGSYPRFYRAPVGIKTPPQALSAWKQKLAFIGWTKWPGDGGPQKLTVSKIRSMLDSMRDGDIVLMHDGKVDLSGNEVLKETHYSGIAECLPLLIEGLREKGLTPVPLDEMLNEPAYSALPAAELKGKAFWRELFRSLVHEHTEPLRLSLALAAGIFIGCSPLFGFHSLLGLMAAAKFRLNKLAVIAGTHISNPITGPFAIFATIQIGWHILTGSWLTVDATKMGLDSTLVSADHILASWLIGVMIFGTGLAVLLGSIFYAFLRLKKAR